MVARAPSRFPVSRSIDCTACYGDGTARDGFDGVVRNQWNGTIACGACAGHGRRLAYDPAGKLLPAVRKPV